MSESRLLAAQLKDGVVNVLVIDDDIYICGGLRDILEDAGYHVATGNCAADAEEILHQQTFCMMVVDYALPDANGMDIARMVHAKYPWTQVIMMTGHDRVEINES